MTERDIEKAMDWFNAHGATAVYLCRLVPGVRSLISLPAGSAGMSMSVFLTYTALGTGLWSLLLTALGWWLSAQYQKVSSYLGPATYVVLVAIAVAAMGWIVRRKRNMRPQSKGLATTEGERPQLQPPNLSCLLTRCLDDLVFCRDFTTKLTTTTQPLKGKWFIGINVPTSGMGLWCQ